MEKLFISCPMRARTAEQIHATMDQMHKIAEAIFGEELEVIPTYFEGTPPENANDRLWYLGKSIEKMSEADCFIGIFDDQKIMMAASSRTMSPNSTVYRSIW